MGKAQQGCGHISVEQRRDLEAGDLDLEVICVQMGVTWAVTGMVNVKWQGDVLHVAHLVLIACQELFLISYAMFVILLVVN